jgi:hypothetical protein
MSTHGPITDEYREKMNAIARTLDDIFNGPVRPKKTGFVLLVFPFGENEPHRDRINYLSNGKREDVIVAMKELIARFEGRHIEEQGDMRRHKV